MLTLNLPIEQVILLRQELQAAGPAGDWRDHDG